MDIKKILKLVLYIYCLTLTFNLIYHFVVENALPIDVRILFFGRGSAKSLTRCVIIAATNSAINTKLHCSIKYAGNI